ncbi:MAG: FtsX-like permease family protein, partial [Clostridiaceae bacterium]|nr:FtsX-like permease family protein [Clostridiaceae bacterium]
MSFTESLLQAIDNIKSNKLRSILTMLGIVMGVFSVITIVAIGAAAQAFMSAQFEKLGANIITIMPSSKSINENDWLKMEDIELIKKAVPDIKNIHAGGQQLAEVRVGANARDAIVVGVTSQSFNFWPNEMRSGRFINDIDVSTKANVVVVNESYAKKYYNSVDIIGEVITLKNSSDQFINLRIIGVMNTGDDFFANMLGDDYPTTINMPLSTYLTYFNLRKIDYIEVSVVDKSKLTEIGTRIVKALEFSKRNKNMYRASNSAEMQKSLSDLMNILSTVLLVIAVITLIVGGIGIVNILLVSVTERIREIGTRKALGAQKRDIVLQFLTESIIMTGLGGLIGIIIGVTAGAIISALL